MPNMDPELFPPLPEDLGALSDDELTALEDERVAEVTRLASEEGNAAELIATMTIGVEQIEAIRAERAGRDAATEAAQGIAAELAARVGITLGGDAPADPVVDEPAVDADPEDAPAEAAVVASGDEPSAPEHNFNRRLRLARRPENRPVETPSTSRVTITASADVPGLALGQEITSVQEIAAGMRARHNNLGSIPKGDVHEKVPVATIRYDYPDELRLDGQDAKSNWAKIQDVVGRKALAASGGICAPRNPYYELQQISTDARPVRDSLPRFEASRGGIRWMPPAKLSAITDAVGVITAAADALGGTNATKSCQHVACASIQETDVDIIYHCLQFGNLGARAFPEQVEEWVELTMAAHAQVSDSKLLDGIAAASITKAVTGAQVGGAINTLLGQIATAGAGIRSRNRMTPDVKFRALLPDWSLDLLLVDMLRQQFNRFQYNEDGLRDLLGTFGIMPVFYLDSTSGGGQVFGAQNAGALLGFPSTCQWFIYPEGSFIWLDGGTLELGVVRDSTLNSTNDYSMFGETFENVVGVGIEALKVTSTVCASGETTLPKVQTCPV